MVCRNPLLSFHFRFFFFVTRARTLVCNSQCYIPIFVLLLLTAHCIDDADDVFWVLYDVQVDEWENQIQPNPNRINCVCVCYAHTQQSLRSFGSIACRVDIFFARFNTDSRSSEIAIFIYYNSNALFVRIYSCCNILYTYALLENSALCAVHNDVRVIWKSFFHFSTHSNWNSHVFFCLLLRI